jgi:NRAMP (natural resistance-associated macrophage protein)-like metal ion transporter
MSRAISRAVSGAMPRASFGGRLIRRMRGKVAASSMRLPGMSWLGRCAGSLGPGLITGAADDDPSGIVTYSIVGAQQGMTLLWLAWPTWPLMAAVQMMCARIGMVTGQGLGSVFERKFPRAVVIVVCCALFVANTINIAADLSGMADAAEMLSGLSAYFFIPLFGAGIALAMVKCRYEMIATILKWLVLSLFAYVVTAFWAHPNWSEVAKATFVPALPKGRQIWEAIVAVLGTTISPYLFFWQSSQEVEETKAERKLRIPRRTTAIRARLVDRMMDVGAGTFLSNLIMFFIILTAALTLHRQGTTNIETSKQAAEALRPLAGNFAAGLYALAIVAVGLLAIPTLAGSAGYAFCESFNRPRGLDRDFAHATAFYAVILLSVGFGVGMDFVGINPMRFLFLSAVINGVLAPFLLFGILLIAGDAKIMKNETSSFLNRAAVGVTTLAMFAAAAAMFYGVWQGDS